jgi:hypothetical protein
MVKQAQAASEATSLNNTMTSIGGGESPKSMVSSVTSFPLAHVETQNAVVPMESSNKFGQQKSSEHKSVRDDMAMLRIVNSEARNHLMHEQQKPHDVQATKQDSSPNSKSKSSHSKASDRLKSAVHSITQGVQEVMVANFAVGFIQEEVEKHHALDEALSHIQRHQTEDAWSSIFTEVQENVDEEEGSEEGETEEQRTARLQRNKVKREKRRARLRSERRAKNHKALHKVKTIVAVQRNSAVRSTNKNLLKGTPEALGVSNSSSSNPEPTTIFAPSSFYGNVASVIGLQQKLRHHRQKAGLNPTEPQESSSHSESGPSTEAVQAKGSPEGGSTKGSPKGCSTKGSPKNASESKESLIGNQSAVAIANFLCSSATSTSAESPRNTHVRFSTALRIINLAKRGRDSLSEVKAEDHDAGKLGYVTDQSPQSLRLPPATPKRGAGDLTIAEEKLDEMEQFQSGGALSSAQKANFLKERAARMAMREAEEFEHFYGYYPYGVMQTRRRLGISEHVSPSRLAAEVWDEETHDNLFDPDDAFNPSISAVNQFPSELVCKTMSKLSVDDVARMFSDIRAPPNVSRPENGLELLERVFGGVHNEKQYPIQWLICEWVLKDLQSRMLQSIRQQRGTLSQDSGLMLGHASGESFKKQLHEVQETLSRHYTMAPAKISWGHGSKGIPGSSSQKDGNEEARAGTADSDATLPRGRSSRTKTPNVIRQAKLPYFPYSNDRLKVLNLGEVPPMNWRSAQAVYMSTQIKQCRSAR